MQELAAEHGALSADHLEHADEDGVAAMARAGTVAVLLPGAFYVLREKQAPPVEALRRQRVPMAIATDSNPGTSPITSLLLIMNMAATLFRLTVDETIAGVTREAARALGRLGEIGTLEPGKCCDLAIWDIERPAELVYRIGFNPLARAGAERSMTVTLTPGRATLADWRTIADGAGARLDPAARPAIEASARTVDAIIARGEPVYGINTGFGKLASVHIAADDLATLQRNIVLSHAAGVGEPMPPAHVRLMMALKLASLGRGASGVRLATVDMLEAMLARDLIPVIPSQGSVGASGDLAPLAHLAAAMLGIGDAQLAGERMPADTALARVGLAPIVLGPKEGLALLNGTQFSTAEALAGLFAIERVFQAALVTGALSTDAAKGSDTPFDARIQALRGHRGQIEVAAALRALMAESSIRASHLVNDDRVQDPYCLRCQPQVMGAVLDLARQAATTLDVEANGVSDNPLIFSRYRRGAVRRQLPRRAGGVRRRHAGARGVRDRLARRAAHRHADRSRALGIAGLSHPAARAQFRVHGGAGDGGGAHRREQAACLSRERQLDPDLGQSGRPRVDGGARRAPPRRHGGERRERRRHRVVGGGARLRFPPADEVERTARARARAAARARAEPRPRPLSGAGHRRRRRSRALRRNRRRRRREFAEPGRNGRMTQPRLDNARVIRAPHGLKLSAKSWQTEAPLRMLMNNLDPAVAEKPHELVVYGGIGRAARDWGSFDRIVAALRDLEADETLCVQSGKPVGVFRTHVDAPRVLIANSNLVPHWATLDHFNELDRKGLMMYGQMTAGSWIYIGSQGIVQGTYETFAELGRRHYGGSLAGKSILTAGLGGMGGAQPLAATMAGASLLAIECQPSRIEMRLKTGYLDARANDLDEALAMMERSRP